MVCYSSIIYYGINYVTIYYTNTINLLEQHILCIQFCHPINIINFKICQNILIVIVKCEFWNDY